MKIEEMTAQVVEAARGFVQRSLVGVNAKLADLETRLAAIPAGPKGEKGDPGPPADIEPLRPAMIEEVWHRVEAVLDEQPEPRQGKDGVDGRDGRDGVPGAPGAPGKDGAAGLDGRDGFGLEDFEMTLGEDGRTISLKFVRGETVVERHVKLATMLYREVWREGEFEPGDVVTWGGSAWHCQATTSDQPGSGSTAWRLMVKKGAPGKDGAAPSPASSAPVRIK